jgi:hypothetical protein
VSSAKAGSPWGSKRKSEVTYISVQHLTIIANNMANGKDFFLELRKQMFALQQQNTNTGGG